MVGDENILPRFVVRRFVNIFMIDAYEKKPDSCPVMAYPEYEITPFDLT
jgi:hypothetical protein